MLYTCRASAKGIYIDTHGSSRTSPELTVVDSIKDHLKRRKESSTENA